MRSGVLESQGQYLHFSVQADYLHTHIHTHTATPHSHMSTHTFTLTSHQHAYSHSHSTLTQYEHSYSQLPQTQYSHSLAYLHSHPICSFMCLLTHSPNIHTHSFTLTHICQNAHSCAHPNPHSPNILTFTNMHIHVLTYNLHSPNMYT